MIRAVVYARDSSDQQSASSIEDQLEVCRRYIDGQRWTLVRSYEDRAISGGSAARPGFQALLADAERDLFEVVVCEAVDRLGRKLADVAALHDRLEFRRIALHAVNMGVVTTMHAGLLGTIAQLYLSDLKEKTRRGLLGRVLQGKAAGGRAYGYRLVHDAAERGGRRVEPGEAAVVRRIFRLYAAGTSPNAIARRLNGENVPGPDGRPWRDSTISGQRDRGTGLLNNELYIGQLVWNRCAYVKDPRSGNRLARPNPPERWERVAVPELRIVDDALWQAVKARQDALTHAVAPKAQGNALHGAHRRRFLLSDLLVCGVCGGGYAIVGKDRYGCAARRDKGTCGNDRTIGRMAIEGRVLEGLKRRLLAPEPFEAFARAYQEECTALAHSAAADRAGLDGRLAAVERKIAAMIRAIEDGLYQPSMKDRMATLEAEKAQLRTAMAAKPAATPVALHPNLPVMYRRKVEELERPLTDAELGVEAMAAIRSTNTRIVLTPRAEGGMEAVLEGDLAAILTICEGAERANARLGGGRSGDVPGRQLSVVAGARNTLHLLSSATFGGAKHLLPGRHARENVGALYDWIGCR